TLTFHGAGYRAMRAIRSLTRHQITVDAEVPSFAAMIAGVTDARALATPAPLLDTQGQLTALFALQSRSNIGLFPVSIERIAFFAPPASSGEVCTLIAACEQTNDTVLADIDVVDARGALTCRISGAEQRIFDWGPTFRRIGARPWPTSTPGSWRRVMACGWKWLPVASSPPASAPHGRR
ncbi:polyketide synthase dehydratase domain-containing protein, partial [bacterium]|nr:polyketide synthase dehydratase domain-containing protein [bacterium]